MSNIINCPHCKNEFPIDQVMQAQLATTIRAELETEFSQKTKKLIAERDELTQIRRQLQASQEQFDDQVRSAVAKEREKIELKAKVVAQQAVAVEIKDRDERLQETEKKVQEFEKQELELRKEKRKLEEQARQQELEITRRLDEEGKRIRDVALKESQEQYDLKLAEADLKNKGLLKQIEELKQKAEQGSQQIQGEVLEIALEEMLASEFPSDVVEPVAKGVKGADVLHHVFDQHGRECGVILWESKRTKRWDNKWLNKIVDDQQDAKATCACVVSTVVPDSIEYLGEINGVWVANWSCARSAAVALRRVILESAQFRRAADGQQSKKEMVYNYLAGPEFRNRVQGIAAAFIQLQQDLDAEKRAFQTRWNKREKQIERALMSTTGLYGDLQGIIGNGLQEIEEMDQLAIEVEDNL
ncbi:MAG: DUF2130 domain-containing protein [Pirellulales bacterium]|nr:DUF2130 domain-containing protein [Pirellulales bacterium]